MKYEITGWTTGGWDVTDQTTSMRKAMAIAKVTMGGFSADDSGSRCRIYRNGIAIKAWSGTTSGRWITVTA